MTRKLTWLLQKSVGSYRNFHSSRCCALFYEPEDKEGYRIKSDKELEWEKLSYWEKVKEELKLWKREFKFAAREFKHHCLVGPLLITRDDEVDVVFRFNGSKEEMDKWVVTTDKDHNLGYSTAK